MHFTPDSEIYDQEILYRAIHPNHWNHEEDRPTSAAFKDKQGVSVDRDGDRTGDQCLTFLLTNRDNYGACSLKAGFVTSIGAFIKPAQLPENSYHALILESEEKIHLSNSKARLLSKTAEIHIKPIK